MSGSRAGRRSRGWIAAAACATAVGCSSEPAPRSAATPAAPTGPAVPCLLERWPLALADGTELYVEYEDVIPVGDDLLLSGSPSYHWNPRPGRAAEQLSADSVAAAYIGDPGRAIAKPISGTLGSVRVAALDDRRWAAIMLEVDPDSLPKDWFRGLWYGEHDGQRWTRLEEVESPGARISSRVSSGLVRAGDRLLWLAWESLANSWGVRLYERTAGRWTHALVPGQVGVEHADLAYSEETGLWMLLSGYDTELPGFQKSLRLYRERSTAGANGPDRWELISRVFIAEPGASPRWGKVTPLPTGVTVTWTVLGPRTGRTMASMGIGPNAPGTIVTLDEHATVARPAAMADGDMVWVVDHADTLATAPELRLLAVRDGQVVRLASLPSPFTASFNVRAVAPTEVVVVGPETSWDPTDVPVRSLILRLSTSC